MHKGAYSVIALELALQLLILATRAYNGPSRATLPELSVRLLSYIIEVVLIDPTDNAGNLTKNSRKTSPDRQAYNATQAQYNAGEGAALQARINFTPVRTPLISAALRLCRISPRYAVMF